ncbi:MAG: hypothetical protein EU539_05905 [Promethearchaeota archaeon]|nr:MAG: hypothetical protein EU539_05905 [Candidatus Lokiarchaeota archaeon]
MILKFLISIFQEDPIAGDDSPANYILDRITGYGSTLFFTTLIIILWFLSGIILAYIIFRDLKKREAVGKPYVIITLFTSIIGFLVYIIVRYNEKCALEENEEACLLDEEDY